MESGPGRVAGLVVNGLALLVTLLFATVALYATIAATATAWGDVPDRTGLPAKIALAVAGAVPPVAALVTVAVVRRLGASVLVAWAAAALVAFLTAVAVILGASATAG